MGMGSRMNNEPLFTVLNWDIRPHLLLMVLGILLCLALAYRLMKKGGIPGKARLAFLALCVPLAFVCGRLGHALVYLSDTLDDPASLLRFGADQFLLLGAGLGLVVAMLLSARIGGNSFVKLSDLAAPALALMLAWSRLLEGLVGLGYSLDITSPARQFFPLGIYDDYWESWAYAAFMLEALAALLIALYLLRRKQDGQRFILLVFLYAVLQIWFESLRRDAYARVGFIRVNQLLCALLVGGIVLYWLLRAKSGITYVLPRCIALLALAGIVMVMEFAVEYKVGFLLELNQRWRLTQSEHYLIDYGVMLAAALLMLWLGMRAFHVQRHSAQANAPLSASLAH